jgi:hypothetical protein
MPSRAALPSIAEPRAISERDRPRCQNRMVSSSRSRPTFCPATISPVSACSVGSLRAHVEAGKLSEAGYSRYCAHLLTSTEAEQRGPRERLRRLRLDRPATQPPAGQRDRHQPDSSCHRHRPKLHPCRRAPRPVLQCGRSRQATRDRDQDPALTLLPATTCSAEVS